MSTDMGQKKDKIQWRRSKVQELLVKGYNHYEIASTLQISRPTISSQNMRILRTETTYPESGRKVKTFDDD